MIRGRITLLVLGISLLSIMVSEGFSASPPKTMDYIRFDEYKVLATSKTSTMQKELSEASQQGWVFVSINVGVTKFGGSELVTVMGRQKSVVNSQLFQYYLLATSKTSTMEKELNRWAKQGYYYRDQTVGNTAFGGEEIVLIMEKRLE